MDRVAVDGINVTLDMSVLAVFAAMAPTDLFVVIENTVAPERSRANNMAVRQDVSLFGVHDEARCLTRTGGIGVKRARLAEVNRDDFQDDSLDGGLPLGSVCLRGGESHDSPLVLVTHARELFVGCGVVSADEYGSLGLELLRRAVVVRHWT